MRDNDDDGVGVSRLDARSESSTALEHLCQISSISSLGIIYVCRKKEVVLISLSLSQILGAIKEIYELLLPPPPR